MNAKRKSTIPVLVIGAIVVVAAAVVVLIAAATGLIWYTSGPPERTFDKPVPTNTNLSNSGSKGASPVSRSNFDNAEAMIAELKERPSIGAFTLQNIVPSHGPKFYQNSESEAKGVYTDGTRSVSFLLANYKSQSDAQSAFARMLERERKLGREVPQEPKAEAGTIRTAFSQPGELTVAACDWSKPEHVRCHRLTSTDEQAIADFSTAILIQQE